MTKSKTKRKIVYSNYALNKSMLPKGEKKGIKEENKQRNARTEIQSKAEGYEGRRFKPLETDHEKRREKKKKQKPKRGKRKKEVKTLFIHKK